MARTQRTVALVTLAALNVFAVAAAVAVVALGAKVGLPIGPRVLHPPQAQPRHPVLPAISKGSRVRARALSARLAKPMSAPELGELGAIVVDPATGTALFSHAADVGATPASTTKLATSLAALSALGPDYQISTEVVGSGKSGDIVLVGGGDPTVTSVRQKPNAYPKMASLPELAKKTAARLKKSGVRNVTLGFDASAYSGPRTAPGWKPNYVSDGNVAPVAALEVDEGRLDPAMNGTDQGMRSRHPARFAATRFATALRHQGLHVASTIRRAKAPPNAEALAQVKSPSLAVLIEHMLTVSDNDLAEAVARQIAIRRGAPASFEGATEAVSQELKALGIKQGVKVFDGSGLSRYNRISPSALTHILTIAAASEREDLRALLTGLPISRFSGTLTHRYATGPGVAAAGDVRAKTGTLNHVSTLAGTVRDADGRLLVYAFMARDFHGGLSKAEAALDRLAATVARCGCH